MADLFVPYNSNTPLILVSLIGVILPLFIFLITSSSIRILQSLFLFVLFFIFVKLFFFFGPKEANYSDGKTSISYGTYVGQSPNIVNSRMLFLVLLTGIFAISLAWLASRPGNLPKEIRRQSPSKSENKVKLLTPKLWYSLVAMALATPFLEGQVQGLKNIVSSPDFDSQQINAWYDFKSLGYTEMKDFWFPYGGMIWVQDGLVGLTLRWILLSTLIIMIFSLVWNKSKINLLQIAPVVLTILLSVNYSIIAIRYAFPLMALITFLAPSTKKHRGYLVIRSLPFATAIWMSPEMSVFVVVLGIIGMFAIRSRRVCDSSQVSMWTWIAPLSSLALLFLSQLFSGQLLNTTHLLLNSREILEYGYSPMLAFNFDISADYFTLFRLSVVALSLMGLIRALSKIMGNFWNSQSSHTDYIQCVIGIYGLFLLQKEMSRGGITLWISMLMGLAISLIIHSELDENFGSNLRTKSAKNTALALSSCSILTVAVVLFATPVGAGTFTTIVRAPQQIKVLLGDLKSNDVHKILFHAAWSQENEKKLIELANLFGPNFEEVSKDNFYILGDRPDIYRAFGKQPYWAISQYNLSPKSSQEKVLKQIQARNPKFVLVDRSISAQNFDSFPSSLRNPIIYRYIVDHYKFVATFGDVDLYEIGRSENGLVSWGNLLSNTLDISALPLVVAPPKVCSQNRTEECEIFLKFRLLEVQNLKLEINCAGESFNLVSSSNLLHRGATYWFPLGHAWFWSNECKIPEVIGTTFEIIVSKTSTSLY